MNEKKQIAIFENDNVEQLESEVNEFLNSENITLVDVKPIFSVCDGSCIPQGMIVIYIQNC